MSETIFFIQFDITSGYRHIDIHPDHHKYLGFSWNFEVIRYFQFTVLPFGLATACYVFTKMLRPFIKRWRSKGFNGIIYIDDGIAGHGSYSATKRAAQVIFQDLTEAGFSLHAVKSNFEPTQQGRWLGVIVDTKRLTFTVPEEKLRKLELEFKHLIRTKVCTAKELARVAGFLSSMHLCIGPIVHISTRKMYHQIERRISWFHPLLLTAGTIEELTFWLQNIKSLNGCTFKPRPVTSQIVFTDASGSGYGGFTFSKFGRLICSGSFTSEERKQSSSFRELFAIKLVLKSYGKILHDQAVQVNVDNLNGVRSLTIGSATKGIHNIAIDIFYYCAKYHIKLTHHWIPREYNTMADFFSKRTDSDTWG